MDTQVFTYQRKTLLQGLFLGLKNCLKVGIMLVVTFNQISKKNILQEGNKITNIFANVTVEGLLIWLFNL